ncbi:MAG: S53 family peptidase [Thaumarchaeota archaeon]|nr:S53 family peptidase [Nitrososphaerota archaeon]
MAPGANIVLVVASSNSGNAINAAEAAAIAAHPNSIFSQSFGIPEMLPIANNGQLLQAHANYVAAASRGITMLASAGDFGATNGFSVQNALYPASDPLVTGVGGTQGLPYNETGTLSTCAVSQTCTSGLSTYTGPCVIGRVIPPDCTVLGYGGEQVWNELDFGVATGGAASSIFARLSYQNGFWGGSTRATSDVSYNAAIDGGVLVRIGFLGGWFLVGGTSAGSPQWAAIFAIVNQARANAALPPIGFANPALYGLGAGSPNFHDITVGNNSLLYTSSGNAATPGWDLPTGLGTPDVANLTSSLS